MKNLDSSRVRDVVIVGGGLAGLVGGMATAALGHRAARSRSPRRRPDPLRASRTVLAELGRSRLRRSGDVDRRAAQRGRHRRGRGAGLVEGSVDERQVHPQRPHRDLPVPHPDAAGRAGRCLDDRASRSPRRCCGTPGWSGSGPASPARPGSSGSTTSRTSGRSQDFIGDLPDGCRGAVQDHGHPVRRRDGRDLRRRRHRLLQPGLEHRRRVSTGASSAARRPSPRASRSRWATGCSSAPRSQEIVHKADSVVVRYRQDGTDHEVRGPVRGARDPGHGVASGRGRSARRHPRGARQGRLRPARERGVPHQRDRAAALGQLLRDRDCPKRSFAIVLNKASIVRGTESVRQPGGSIMTFSPAGLGRALLDKSDEEIVNTHLDDLDQVLGSGFADQRRRGDGVAVEGRLAVLLPGPGEAAADPDAPGQPGLPGRRLPRHPVHRDRDHHRLLRRPEAASLLATERQQSRRHVAQHSTTPALSPNAPSTERST